MLSLVPDSLPRIRSNPYFRFATPNFPSTSFRFAESSLSIRLFSDRIFPSFGGLPNRGPLRRILLSAHQERFARVRNAMSAQTTSG